MLNRSESSLKKLVNITLISRKSWKQLILSSMLGVLLLIVGASTVQALNCGDTVTTSVLLTTDLGPCSGDGLIVTANNITVDLNRHNVTGNGVNGSSVGVRNLVSRVTINGSGIISGFGTGILLRGPCPGFTSGNTVSSLNVTNNTGSGISVSCSNNNSVGGNSITANRKLGVFIDNGGNNKINGNIITGHNASVGTPGTSINGGGAGIEIHVGASSEVNGNVINRNTNGLVMDGFSGSSTIKGNVFSSNTQDGLVTIAGGNMIQANVANNNGRDGISVSQGNLNLIKSNIANNNGRRGIGLGDAIGFSSGSGNKVNNNIALHNALDLFWDGLGNNNCWRGNIFITRNRPLPSC